mgnify:CR=1 FL=1
MWRTDNVENQKRDYFISILIVVAVIALFVYLIFGGTTGSRNGNDAKDAVRETQEYSKQSADAVRSAGDKIKSAGEQLDRSISRVNRAAESADRVQKRIDRNAETIAECRDIIADGRRELNEAADIFRQIDEENR